MVARYPELGSDYEILQELVGMGVDVFDPVTKSEQFIAQMMDDFSSFVLYDGREKCLKILEDDLCNGGNSVGELQGGSEAFSIYRVSFPPNDFNEEASGTKKCNNAAISLVREFNEYNQQIRRKSASNNLTLETIKQYMLAMCDRRSKERSCTKYSSLGNLMFILQFGGPTEGQVRHIDNMVPNLQICLYMSQSCPSTVLYAMDDVDGFTVRDGKSLLELWEQKKWQATPPLLKHILQHQSDRALKSKWYTKFFSFWKTINIHLECFGKLYQPVSFQLGLQTDPGTTLIAGGNEVHAGPATSGPRMFAFAIGIPEEIDATDNEKDQCEESFGNDDNDGEVQYSPVLLHIDFCCLLFSILDYEYAKSDNAHAVREAKLFLINILIDLIKDYPIKGYLRQIDPVRTGILIWLENVLNSLDCDDAIAELMEKAVCSDEIFYTPDIAKRRSKKKKRR